MTLFRFKNPNNLTKMEHGVVVDDILSLEWIDRYQDAGEFKVTAYADTGIIKKLPKGSFVGLSNNANIMMVEDHSFTDGGSDAIATVSGRSFEAFLDNRIVGCDVVYPMVGVEGEDTLVYSAANDLTWDQAVYLIRNHVYAPNIEHQPKNAISYIEAHHGTITGDPSTSEARKIDRKTVYSALLEILKIDNLGIRTMRPGRHPGYGEVENTIFFIHRGVNRQDSVVFAYDSEDIDSADYLWSNRDRKNCALVKGKWVEVLVDTSKTGIERRMMLVDASDVDDAFTIPPAGPFLTAVVDKLMVRGREALAKQKEITLTNVDFPPNADTYIYGRHYNIGDIVTVRGSFQESRAMRVIEYVHIEDENGVSGYPTLSDIETENP